MNLDDLFDKMQQDFNIKKITDYVSNDSTVKVTRIHKNTKRDRIYEYKVTFGKPNYAEREYLKKNKGFRGLRFIYYKKV